MKSKVLHVLKLALIRIEAHELNAFNIRLIELRNLVSFYIPSFFYCLRKPDLTNFCLASYSHYTHHSDYKSTLKQLVSFGLACNERVIP